MAVVTTEIVLHVARLARLRLEGRTLAHLAAQLDDILQYVQQLRAVSTEGVEPTSHVLPLTNVLRPDDPQPPLGQETVTGLAPATHAPFVAVPKVIDA